MKIEAGQWWRTKRGEIVRVVGQSIVTGQWCVELESGAVRWVDSSGTYHFEDCNLVEHLPWCASFDCEEPKPPKPKKVEGWVNVYPHAMAIHESLDSASQMKSRDRLKCIFVREVCTDEDLFEIADAISMCELRAEILEILKKHFGRPSDV